MHSRASLLALAAALCVLALTAGVVAQSNPYNIWAHYTFDTTVFTDSGPEHHDGVTEGSGPTVDTIIYKFGTGSAYNPDPSESGYVEIAYERSDEWTFTFWLYATATGLTATIWKKAPGGTAGDITFALTNGVLALTYGSNAPVTWNKYALPAKTWTFYAAVVSVATEGQVRVELYVNDENVASDVLTAPPSITSVNYAILQYGGYHEDELWIFNSALESDVITQLYNSNTLPPGSSGSP